MANDKFNGPTKEAPVERMLGALIVSSRDVRLADATVTQIGLSYFDEVTVIKFIMEYSIRKFDQVFWVLGQVVWFLNLITGESWIASRDSQYEIVVNSVIPFSVCRSTWTPKFPAML